MTGPPHCHPHGSSLGAGRYRSSRIGPTSGRVISKIFDQSTALTTLRCKVRQRAVAGANKRNRLLSGYKT